MPPNACACPTTSTCSSCRRISPELPPAEHLWPLTNTALYNRHFQTIEDLEEAQLAHCAALQRQPERIRSTTLFHWWPHRLKKRQGPRRS
jgi:hypothetical protein